MMWFLIGVAAYDTGWKSVRSDSSWVFLERFCLIGDNEPSSYNLEVTGAAKLLVYHGLTDFGSSSMEERVSKAREVYNDTVHARFRLDRARFVFVVAATYDGFCNDCSGPVVIDYRFRFRNKGSEFGYDQFFLLPMASAFVVMQTLAVAGALLVRRMLVVKRKLHFSARMLCESVVFEWLSQIVSLAYYARYGDRGRASQWLLVMAGLLRIAADVELVVVFLIVAEGWTIVRRKLPGGERIRLVFFAVTYAVDSIIVLVWSQLAFDPAVIGFPYDRLPGAFLASLKAVAAVAFFHATTRTLRNFDAKRRFYRKLRVFGTAWFLALPLTVIITHNTNDVARAQVFFALDRAGFVAGQFVLLFLYNPSTTFNRSFPFHAMNAHTLGLVKKRPSRPRNPPQVESQHHAGGKIVVDDDNRLHLKRMFAVNQALVDRVDGLASLAREFGEALDLVHIPPTFSDEQRAPTPIPRRRLSHPRQQRFCDSSRADSVRPFAGPRTLLDDAIDATLPRYASARSRPGVHHLPHPVLRHASDPGPPKSPTTVHPVYHRRQP